MDNLSFSLWGAAFLSLPLSWQLAMIFVFGACLGSFLNVVAYRLPMMLERDWRQQSQAFLNLEETTETTEKMNLSEPASHCPHCGARLKIRDKIPLVSYLLLRGKCRACQKSIATSYFVVELLSGLMSVFIFSQLGATLQSFAIMGFAFALIVLALIDMRHLLLPDVITLPLLWAGLLLSLWQVNGISSQMAIVGAAVGYCSLWLVAFIFQAIFKHDGMGLGDAKLLAAMMAWIDIQYFPYLLLLACGLGLFGTVILWLVRKQKIRNNPIAFGPYLAVSGLAIKLFDVMGSFHI